MLTTQVNIENGPEKTKQKIETKNVQNNDEHQYLNLIKHVMANGKNKSDRTGKNLQEYICTFMIT